MSLTQEMELRAVEWLRYERQCSLVCLGRDVGVALYGSLPDVLGVTDKRRAVEIEIKRSMADFRANARKDRYPRKGPSQFYFLVPEAIAEKCLAELDPETGLLSYAVTNRPRFIALKKLAPVRHQEKLSLNQCVRMSRNQAGTLCSLLHSVVELQNRVNDLWARMPKEAVIH